MKKIISFLCLLWGIVLLAEFAFGGEIHRAVRGLNSAKIEALLNENPQLLSERDELGKTPMYYAAGKSRLKTLELLLDVYHADVNIPNSNGATPLHAAAFQGNPECVKFLLEHGAFVNGRTNNNSTPLHYVALKGRKSCFVQAAKILINYGVEINAETDSGLTALDLAIARNNNEMAEMLKEKNAISGSGRKGQRR